MIVILRVGVLHAGQDLDHFEVAVPEGAFAQLLHQKLLGVMMLRVPHPDIRDSGRVELHVEKAGRHARPALLQDWCELLPSLFMAASNREPWNGT